MVRLTSDRMVTILVVVGIVIAGGVFQVVPVRSQSPQLEALRVEVAVPFDDPWAPVWDTAARERVPLSAQNVSPPFGGGTVASLTARALYDTTNLYLMVEWRDGTVDDTVNSSTAFSDAVAVQFPSAEAETLPPYTMGASDLPVNIWHWKAVWQSDIERGFAGGDERYPNTIRDGSPLDGDPLYATAAAVGNVLADPDHPSPVENMIAGGFGSATSAEIQDVGGVGAWRDGTWRAMFYRPLQSAGEGHARFAPGAATQVAFAVWDGAAGDRNGQKSIAQFVELDLVAAAAPPPGVIPIVTAPGAGSDAQTVFVLSLLLAVAVVVAIAGWMVRPSRRSEPPV